MEKNAPGHRHSYTYSLPLFFFFPLSLSLLSFFLFLLISQSEEEKLLRVKYILLKIVSLFIPKINHCYSEHSQTYLQNILEWERILARRNAHYSSFHHSKNYFHSFSFPLLFSFPLFFFPLFLHMVLSDDLIRNERRTLSFI